MVTRTLAPLLIAVAALNGCGGGDDAEAKQAALTPAPSAPAAEAPHADSAATSAAATAGKAVKPDSAAIVPAVTKASDSAAVAGAPVDSVAPVADESIHGREHFSYTGGSRDPFASLLNASRLGPELPDLILVAIYYDTKAPNNSVVVMREKIGNRKYNLRPGDRLGRMRVSGVRPKDVTFTIDDFGTERQETVSLRKQEDVK